MVIKRMVLMGEMVLRQDNRPGRRTASTREDTARESPRRIPQRDGEKTSTRTGTMRWYH